MRYCVLGELFIAGSPAKRMVSVGLLGRASMMLEDPILVRTPRILLTRRSCALFECVITTLILVDSVITGNRPNDDRKKYR